MMQDVVVYFSQALTWALAHPATLLGTLLLISIPTVYMYWRVSINRAIRKKLQFDVDRDPVAAKTANWHKLDPILGYLELDTSVAVNDFPHIPMLSVGEYMASLHPKGSFSLQGALVSVLEKKGLRMALPLAMFAPPSWRKNSSLVGAFGNSPYASLMFTNMLSTLGLISVSTVAQRQAIDARRLAGKQQANAKGGEQQGDPSSTAQDGFKQSPTSDSKSQTNNSSNSGTAKPKSMSPIEIMVRGAKPEPSSEEDAFALRMPMTFTLPQDLVAEVSADPAIRAGKGKNTTAPESSLIHPLFPQLESGNGGMNLVCSVQEAKVNEVFAAVLNRLAANSLVGLNASPVVPSEPFVVNVPINGGSVVKVTSVEGLIQALEQSGHTVTVQIASNITSFGMGLCLQEENEGQNKRSNNKSWTQLPLAYPLLTGLLALDDQGKGIDVVTLMTHAGALMILSGPLINASVEWCLNIRGMTGWVGDGGISRPWACSAATKSQHAEAALATPEGRRKALRLTTTSAAVLNTAASAAELLLGGYGILGVCIDSVAAIQKVLTGSCSLYPLVLGGDAKMVVLSVYRHIQKLGRQAAAQQPGADGYKTTRTSLSNSVIREGKWEYDEEASALHDALLALPCDGIVEPRVAAETARRALASLPERSVFLGVKKAKEALERAIKTAESSVM